MTAARFGLGTRSRGGSSRPLVMAIAPATRSTPRGTMVAASVAPPPGPAARTAAPWG